MSNEPILLFLHGVGDGDRDDNWKTVLNENLVSIGYPELDTERAIAPKYANALKGWDEKVPLPGLKAKQPLREAAKKNRRDFERRTGALELRLGRPDRGIGWVGGEAVIDAAFKQRLFVQARNYLTDPQIRAQVLHRILNALPESGRLVIVGHSLGSVIAADLVRRLPTGLEVAGMVTIGSPLASGNFDVDKLRETLREPPTNLQWWVNFWNGLDPVAAHRGVSSVFPWIIDLRIDTGLSLHVHDAAVYLADETVAEAIGFGVFGSRSRELARVKKGLDIPMDTAEQLIILALRYAHLIKEELSGDLKDRYAGALRQVQATVVDAIGRRNSREKRAMPFEIARLAFDLSDPDALVPEPLPGRHIGKDDAVALLTSIAAQNIIQPFEISVPKDKLLVAIKELSAEMGLGSQYGADVITAAKRAQEALNGGRGVNWVKWGVMGAGAVAIVLATGGLALAAGAGLTGAAVITSALAAFGPGGMIGGLLTAGTLVTAGGGGVAFGLASPGTTAATVEAVVTHQLSAVILRQLQHLEQDQTLWRTLVETEIEVRRQHERLDEFSDKSAQSVKELTQKISAIEHALKYLKDHGLEPDIDSNTEAEADGSREQGPHSRQADDDEASYR
ncbi:lipase family protein [Arthrobacter cryoconiti]|uniref:Lipase family protein n=1 Tax=Arthrobacter cryoconiti TaxID=748907 RepID=A0ABV8R552_9MICC|nr:lipase family protein [Arthrobacter cryoconiti]MCC9066727.1 lipase family protein [Arthrobacter cryoconiti]